MNAANIPARVASEELIRDLVDARGIELELLEGIPDSGMFGTKKHFIEPPIRVSRPTVRQEYSVKFCFVFLKLPVDHHYLFSVVLLI